MIDPTTLTPASADLLNKIELECELFDGGESGEAPFYHGELSRAEAGNLLDLKLKGLVTTCEEENGTIGSSETRLWIILTDKYRALYIKNPLTFRYIRDRSESSSPREGA